MRPGYQREKMFCFWPIAAALDQEIYFGQTSAIGESKRSAWLRSQPKAAVGGNQAGLSAYDSTRTSGEFWSVGLTCV